MTRAFSDVGHIDTQIAQFNQVPGDFLDLDDNRLG